MEWKRAAENHKISNNEGRESHMLGIYIYKSNNVCVRVHVFVIDGQSFKPISMRFETGVPLISRRVKTKFSRKKIRPPPPQIWLYLKKFNRNTFVSSSWDCKLK